MRKAEKRIAEIRAGYLERVASTWRGFERELVIEMVRGLDEAAFAFTMAPNSVELLREDAYRHNMLFGGASALKPFLDRLKNDEGGVPWGPTSPRLGAMADEHLYNCGKLAMAQRVAELERFGLAEATFLGKDRLILEVVSDAEDYAELKASALLASQAHGRLEARKRQLSVNKPAIAAKLDKHVYAADGWFIGYGTDDDLDEYHQEFAKIQATGTAEAQALPAEAMLGGRTFRDWNEASLTAYGGVLKHIAFATRLMATTPGLDLRNLLTMFARKDDIAKVWEARGENAAWAARVTAGLTLDAEAAAICERDHELPLPYYIDYGRHFVLLPMFGGLMNPCAGLVWHLRREHRTDWDRSVDGREAVFRQELRELFPPPRYEVPNSGVMLRRANGSDLTDVDAAVLDRSTGELVLIQLKWPDIYGRSLAERNSRRLNLLKANDWVEAVSNWVAGRSAGEIATAIGMKPAGKRPPVLLVLARQTARFSSESGYDKRARWMSWPTLVDAYRKAPRAGILALLRHRSAPQRRSRASGTSIHHLPGLTVEIRSTEV